MPLVQATEAGRCGNCGRALLIPLLREVAPVSDGAAPRSLARCARCGSRNLMHPAPDRTREQRAAAIGFVTRGAPRLPH
jgi:DNA-directed RNA polymerase subunit RPC12/RpoP